MIQRCRDALEEHGVTAASEVAVPGETDRWARAHGAALVAEVSEEDPRAEVICDALRSLPESPPGAEAKAKEREQSPRRPVLRGPTPPPARDVNRTPTPPPPEGRRRVILPRAIPPSPPAPPSPEVEPGSGRRARVQEGAEVRPFRENSPPATVGNRPEGAKGKGKGKGLGRPKAKARPWWNKRGGRRVQRGRQPWQ